MLGFIFGIIFALCFRQGIEERDTWMGCVYQALAVVTIAGAVVWAG